MDVRSLIQVPATTLDESAPATKWKEDWVGSRNGNDPWGGGGGGLNL
jgi:hypothetical protein